MSKFKLIEGSGGTGDVIEDINSKPEGWLIKVFSKYFAGDLRRIGETTGCNEDEKMKLGGFTVLATCMKPSNEHYGPFELSIADREITIGGTNDLAKLAVDRLGATNADMAGRFTSLFMSALVVARYSIIPESADAIGSHYPELWKMIGDENIDQMTVACLRFAGGIVTQPPDGFEVASFMSNSNGFYPAVAGLIDPYTSEQIKRSISPLHAL